MNETIKNKFDEFFSHNNDQLKQIESKYLERKLDTDQILSRLKEKEELIKNSEEKQTPGDDKNGEEDT